MFIALLGLQNAGIVVPDESTCVDLGSFNLPSQHWGDIMPMVVTRCTFLAIVIMAQKKVRGSVLVGIIGGMVLYYLLGITVNGFYEQLQICFISPFEAFGEFREQLLFKVFTDDFDFSAYTAEHGPDGGLLQPVLLCGSHRPAGSQLLQGGGADLCGHSDDGIHQEH